MKELIHCEMCKTCNKMLIDPCVRCGSVQDGVLYAPLEAWQRYIKMEGDNEMETSDIGDIAKYYASGFNEGIDAGLDIAVTLVKQYLADNPQGDHLLDLIESTKEELFDSTS